jgi:hypothetical protein
MTAGDGSHLLSKFSNGCGIPQSMVPSDDLITVQAVKFWIIEIHHSSYRIDRYAWPCGVERQVLRAPVHISIRSPVRQNSA